MKKVSQSEKLVKALEAFLLEYLKLNDVEESTLEATFKVCAEPNYLEVHQCADEQIAFILREDNGDFVATLFNDDFVGDFNEYKSFQKALKDYEVTIIPKKH